MVRDSCAVSTAAPPAIPGKLPEKRQGASTVQSRRAALCFAKPRYEFSMPSDPEFIERLYDRFNARDMEAVLAMMHTNVLWANGMEGGHASGHDEVRAYWTRQWAMIDPRVEPTG